MMFKALKKALSGSKSEDQFPQYNVPMTLIFNQLPFCGLDPIQLAEKLEGEEFALGYVFGMADMASYQFGARAGDQSKSLSYIQKVFTETLGSRADGLLQLALNSQASGMFQKGREIGANELGEWLQTSGQKVPMGLSRQLG